MEEKPKMELSVLLSQRIQLPGWDFKMSPDALILDTPSKTDALNFLDLAADAIAQSAFKLKRQYALIRYPDCSKPYRLPATSQEAYLMSSPNATGIQFPELLLPPELFPFVARWMENPEIKGGIVALPSERQIILTNGCNQQTLCIWGTATGVLKKRPDFWFLPDLEEMRKRSKQEDDFEFTWHSRIQRSNGSYAKFTHHYQRITDSSGINYQISENIGFELVKALPVRV